MSKELEDRIDAALADVKRELFKAMSKHRPMASAHEGASVIREEFEVELFAGHVCKDTAETPEGRKEAVQVAAMAVRFILDVCDGGNKLHPDYQDGKLYVFDGASSTFLEHVPAIVQKDSGDEHAAVIPAMYGGAKF